MSGLPFRRGRYVIYQAAAPDRPGWPAVICGQRDLPTIVQQRQAHSSEIPILLFQKEEIRWANHYELEHFHSQTWSEEDARKHPGLKAAFHTLLNAISEDLPFMVWRVVIQDRYLEQLPEEESEPEIPIHAISRARVSRSNSIERKSQDEDIVDSLTVQSSIDRKGKRRATAMSSEEEPGRKKQHSSTDQKALLPQEKNDLPPLSMSNDDVFLAGPSKMPLRGEGPSTDTEVGAPKPHSSDAQSNWINNDPEFVRFLIGAKQREFHIPLRIIREHGFCEANLGIVQKNGKGWSFERPALRKILPDEFALVADFLYSGDFGHRQMEDAMQRSRGLTECAEAWIAGEAVGIEPLLDYIVSKIPRTAPWHDENNMETVLIFASRVWETPGTPMTAHMNMKTMLANFIGENFFNYLHNHHESFMEQLNSIHEFAADVYRAMAAQAEAKGAQEEIEGIDGN